jgi:DNA-binding transcriptional regulator YiaG
VDIKELRTKLGFTQITLAIKCNVSLSSVRMWEAGVTKPTEENLKKLKEVLKLEEK